MLPLLTNQPKCPMIPTTLLPVLMIPAYTPWTGILGIVMGVISLFQATQRVSVRTSLATQNFNIGEK